MAHKPIKVSAIAAIVVAGILTLCLVTTKPLTNQAFAATTCNLTVKADPSSGSLAVGESIGSTISGTLTCGGTGLGGATIDLTGLSSSMSAKTDSSGNYDKGILVGASVKPLTVTAHYAGDSEHTSDTVTTQINFQEKNSGRVTPLNTACPFGQVWDDEHHMCMTPGENEYTIEEPGGATFGPGPPVGQHTR